MRLAELAHRSRRNHFPDSTKSSGNEPPLDSPPVREESYDRVRRDSRCLVQHQHLPGSCVRRVLDALMGIFTDRSTLPGADPSTVWLADLIEATEVVAASAEPCDPAIVRAFRHRLETRADCPLCPRASSTFRCQHSDCVTGAKIVQPVIF